MFESRVVCGTTGFDFREKGNSAVRLEAGLNFGTTFTRGCTAGLFSTVPQKARHCSGRCSLRWSYLTGLQHAASLSKLAGVFLGFLRFWRGTASAKRSRAVKTGQKSGFSRW